MIPELEAFARRLLQELDQVSAEQLAMFLRIYPKGVPTDRLESAIDLVGRTIAKNKADPARLEKAT